jgi:hypothetical protein
MLEVTHKTVSRISHLWILLENKVEIVESPGHEKIHAEVWGEEAWEIPERGYFCKETGIVTCHSHLGISKEIIKKIERKFDKADLVSIYFRGKIKETV